MRLTTSTPFPVVPVQDHSRFNGGSVLADEGPAARNSFAVRAALSGGPSGARSSSRPRGGKGDDSGASSDSEDDD